MKDLNEVRVCGVITTEFFDDRESTGFDPIKFSVRTNGEDIECIAEDHLSIKIQKRCMRGMRIMICGEIVYRAISHRNYLHCIKVIADNEEGFIEELLNIKEE